MAVADTAKLIVDLSLKGNFARQLGAASKATKQFDKDASRAYKAGTQIGTGIKRGATLAAVGVGLLVTQIGFGLDQLIQLESLTAQTNAALKSTKGIAGQTAASIRNLAEKYEGLNATIDDKVIQSGANVLLTFTNIRKQAFEPALSAALDLSVAMGQDLQSSIVQVGKALNDPIRGITALRRVGVQLSPQQEKQIKQFVKQGKTLEAQKVILAELNKEFGGSFLAGGTTTAGKVAKFGDAIEDLQKALASALLPAVSNIADALTDLFQDPQTIAAVEDLSRNIGKLFSPANIKSGIGALKEGFGALKAIAGPIADVIGTAVKAFTSLPPDIQKLLVGGIVVNKLTGGLVTNVFGGIAEAIAKSFIRAPLVNVQGGVVNVAGGIGGGTPFTPSGNAGGGVTGLLKGLPIIGAGIAAAEIANQVASGVAGAIKTALPGPVGTTISGAIQTTVGLFSGALGIPNLIGGVQDLVGQVSKLVASEKNDRDLDRPKFTGPQGAKDAERQRKAIEVVQTKVESMKGKIAGELAKNKQAVDNTKSAVTSAKDRIAAETTRGASTVRSQTQISGANIVSAINGLDVAPRITVNVTPSGTTIIRRYGTTAGSRWIDNTSSKQQSET